ncbi:hypothetical protein [Methylobacterium marchantiae]|uniref:PRTRC system protein F n=1 Tax=Methylobacterium marchantiae TaxID=600331 RepID=A0ABW3X605_9HYPH|nr:hypothetical protein AIGOOFII_4294 [Methylobacterium marchantiae]
MEQRHCVDRTPVSKVQAFATGALTDRDIDAAATKLLTRPAAVLSVAAAQRVAAVEAGLNADADVLELGRKHDEAHAVWRRAVEAYRGPDEQHTAFIEAAKARGGPTMAVIIEGEKIPGYKEGYKADEDAFGIVGDIGLEILKHRPTSVAGLAVLARALVPHVWPTGSFEKDAALAPDEDMDKEAVRHMVEACCAAAGVDWRGVPTGALSPLAGGHADPVFALMERHRQTYADWLPHEEATGNVTGGDPARERIFADAKEPGERERAAYDALLTARPSSLAGLAALAAYLPQAVINNGCDDADAEGVQALGSVCDAVLSLMPGSEAEPDAGAVLVGEILDAWGEWAKTCSDGSNSDDEEAWKRNSDIRDDLIDRAADLPATRENAAAKAIAQCWLEYVSLWERSRPRDSYGIDGRLCFDIHDAAQASVAGDTPAAVEAIPLPDVAAISLRELRGLYDIADLLHELCHALKCQPRCHDDRMGDTPAGAFAGQVLDQCVRLMGACEAEANRRKPATLSEADERLCILARAVIENGDPAQTAALARDLQASVA